LRTDLNGLITIRTDGKHLSVETSHETPEGR
jgi:beta-lactamase superfamily II metal-dependent hydrolase